MAGAMLGISTISMVNGGKGRVSSFVAALLVMIVMFGAYPLLNYIPLGVLVGMLFVVAIRLFKWFTISAIVAELLPTKLREKLKIQNSRIELVDLSIIIIVTVITVVYNLVIASAIGIVIAALSYAYKNSNSLEVKSEIREKGHKLIKVYIVEGPVFYGSKKRFFKYFQIKDDPQYVQIDFDNDLYMDYTFIEALNKLCKKYKDSGREIKIKKLRRTAQQTVEKFQKFVNNIEFIEEKIELPGVPQFIEAHNKVVNEIKENERKDDDSQITNVSLFFLFSLLILSNDILEPKIP